MALMNAEMLDAIRSMKLPGAPDSGILASLPKQYPATQLNQGLGSLSYMRPAGLQSATPQPRKQG
jgi:hypothetical protein